MQNISLRTLQTFLMKVESAVDDFFCAVSQSGFQKFESTRVTIKVINQVSQ